MYGQSNQRPNERTIDHAGYRQFLYYYYLFFVEYSSLADELWRHNKNVSQQWGVGLIDYIGMKLKKKTPSLVLLLIGNNNYDDDHHHHHHLHCHHWSATLWCRWRYDMKTDMTAIRTGCLMKMKVAKWCEWYGDSFDIITFVCVTRYMRDFN